jgi:hypothetical protein
MSPDLPPTPNNVCSLGTTRRVADLPLPPSFDPEETCVAPKSWRQLSSSDPVQFAALRGEVWYRSACIRVGPEPSLEGLCDGAISSKRLAALR